MNPKFTLALVLGFLICTNLAFADGKTAPKLPSEKLTPHNKTEIIRGMTAELGFARKAFPFGRTGLTVKDGKVTPDDSQLDGLVATYGPALKPGDRALITNVKFKDKSIVLELNGGPVRKKKWYEHITVAGMGGEVTPGSQSQQQQPTGDENFHGSFVVLDFDKYVPNLTPEQVKLLLDPVLNFHAKSASEAYLETIPPKAKTAIKNHEVLVGMNREMVEYAKGRPPQKTREKDASGADYEEWIYGVPPQQVEFVRFNGDEVVRVETMKVDGTKLVKTQREITLQPDQPQLAQTGQQPAPAGGAAGPAQPASDAPPASSPRPSLRRPGEEVGQPGAASPNPNPPAAPQAPPSQPGSDGPGLGPGF